MSPCDPLLFKSISIFLTCHLLSLLLSEPQWFPIKSLWVQGRRQGYRCGVSRAWTWSQCRSPCTVAFTPGMPTFCSSPPQHLHTTFTCGSVRRVETHIQGHLGTRQTPNTLYTLLAHLGHLAYLMKCMFSSLFSKQEQVLHFVFEKSSTTHLGAEVISLQDIPQVYCCFFPPVI